MDPQFKYVTVVSEKCYLLDAGPDGLVLDGRKVEDIVKAWFEDFPLHQSRASRDYYKVGGYEKLISVQIADWPPWKEG